MLFYLCLDMEGVLSIKATILPELEFPLDIPSVFESRVVSSITLAAFEGNLFDCSLFRLCHSLSPPFTFLQSFHIRSPRHRGAIRITTHPIIQD